MESLLYWLWKRKKEKHWRTLSDQLQPLFLKALINDVGSYFFPEKLPTSFAWGRSALAAEVDPAAVEHVPSMHEAVEGAHIDTTFMLEHLVLSTFLNTFEVVFF